MNQSIRLHQRDNGRLLQTLTKLRDLGNTLIVVEHDGRNHPQLTILLMVLALGYPRGAGRAG